MTQHLIPPVPQGFQLPKGFWSHAITGVAALAAVVSAVFAGAASSDTRRALRQQQESLLLSERIDACVIARNAAGDVDQAYRHVLAYRELTPPGLSASEIALRRSSAASGLSDSLTRFRDAEKLELLGPHALAQAEANLEHALSELVAATWDEEKTFRDLYAFETAVMEAQVALHHACVRSVGAYRVGPQEAVPPMIDRPWLFKQE